MEISFSEYEQRRTAFELCDWINQKLRELEDAPGFNQAYFERKGSNAKNVKRLLEEAVPVARLGLYLWQPWRKVLVTCLTGNQPHDAVIELQDPEKQEVIHVEVTTIETQAIATRRQALARNGFVSFTGSISRERNAILTEPEMVNDNEECKRVLNLAYERFLSKVKGEQDPRTAILVYVNTYWLFPSWQHRYQLLEKTRQYLIRHQPALYGVYYCYDPAQGVEGLRNNTIGLAY